MIGALWDEGTGIINDNSQARKKESGTSRRLELVIFKQML